MAYTTIKLNDDGTIEGKALDAVMRAQYGRTFNVCSPKYGADPSGVKDSTAAIQAAVDDAARYFGGVVVIPGGEFRVSPPFINLKGYVSIRGEGVGSTHLFADASKINDSTVENGVFHTGTYAQSVQDAGAYRVSIRELSIHATLADGTISKGADGQYYHVPKEQMQSKAWGITFNTYLGEGPADPDAVHTIKDVEIWDMAGGMAFLGLDDQGCKVSDIRVRRTMKQGMLVGKPDDHPEAWTAGADQVKPIRQTGSADNKFHRIDISGGNQSGGGYAGVEIYTAQCMFSQCTSWYNRRYTTGAVTGAEPAGDEKNIWNLKATRETAVPGQVNLKTNMFRFAKDGAGWYVDGTRNEFANCTSQETGGHGWVIVGQLCTFDSCRGESFGHEDACSGDARTGEPAGFVVTNWAWGSRLDGCIAQNGHARAKGGKVGFYVQDYLKKTRIRDGVTVNMPFKNGVDGEENAVVMPAHPDVEVVVEVNDLKLSTLSSDKVAASSGGGSVAAAVAESTPAEIGSIMAHWDFSDTSKITSAAGRVSAVSLKAGTATDGTLAQSDTAKQPWLSSLGGMSALKFKRAESDSITASALGSAPASSGWSIVMVASIAVAHKNQYLWSSSQSATKPASLTTNDWLAVIANTGGSTNGYTAVTDKGAMALNVPAVIAMVTTATGVSVFVNGVKSSLPPSVANTPMDLVGKVTLGSHYAGSDFADATLGEVVAFSRSLSDVEVGSVSAYLYGKWVK